MLKLFKLAIAAALAVTSLGITAPSASAQNYALSPSYGSIRLRAGFLPDPVTRTVRAGGDHRFNGGGGCPGGGWFANAPDYRLHYSAGGYALTIWISAPGDTMLLVNDPNGQWWCNDDYNGLDPLLRFNNPLSGQYDIWAGTYGNWRVHNATIYISER